MLLKFYKAASKGSVRPDIKAPVANSGNTDRIVRDAKDGKPFLRAVERELMGMFFGLELKNEPRHDS